MNWQRLPTGHFALPPDNERALKADTLAGEFNSNKITSSAYDNIAKAVKDAYDDSIKRHIPLIALGSFYMYADVKSALSGLL